MVASGVPFIVRPSRESVLEHMNDVSLSRRGFIKAGAAAAVFISIEWPAEAGTEPKVIAGWVKIAPDNTTTIFSNTSELGQGTGTALAQLVADELDVAWKDVRLEMAPLDDAHINPFFGEYATSGAAGVQYQADMYRLAGARARAMLVAAAGQRWNVAADACTTDEGFVIHAPSRRKIAYGKLADATAAMAVPEKPALKSRESWRFIGKPMPRLDIPDKTNGVAVFGIDVKIAGMKYATIMQCPHFGGSLKSVDPAPAMTVAGVEHVVPMTSAVAVVGNSYWTARNGLHALTPEWDLANASRDNSKDYRARLNRALAGNGIAYAPKGTTTEALAAAHEAAMAKATRTLEAVYEAPFVSHATMEPMNATARPYPGGMELWLPTQVQSANRDSVAKLLGVSPAKIIVHTTLSGGAFGRRAELDVPLQAAEIAQKIGVPIKLIWSREEDMQHGWYRPAAAIKLAAGVDEGGNPIAWRFETACASIAEWSQYGAGRLPAGAVDTRGLMGFVGRTAPAYALAAPKFAWTRADAGVPVTIWRSVGLSQNVFALESFIDELATQVGRDPIAYRRQMLAGNARALRVFDVALERAGWNEPAPSGHARGFAMAFWNGSLIANVVELSVSSVHDVKLHRIACVADCGLSINPDSVAAQMQGGIVFGLTAAFLSEITIEEGRVQQANFDDFPLAALAQVPDIDVTVLLSEEKSAGAGEVGVAAIAPALANAIFAATGKRLRRMPFKQDGFTLI
jgi:isoquinoline 1-oxidoreductase beta subunit